MAHERNHIGTRHGAQASFARGSRSALRAKYSTFWRHWNGSRRLFGDVAAKYADALGIPRSELRPDLRPPGEAETTQEIGLQVVVPEGAPEKMLDPRKAEEQETRRWTPQLRRHARTMRKIAPTEGNDGWRNTGRFHRASGMMKRCAV